MSESIVDFLKQVVPEKLVFQRLKNEMNNFLTSIQINQS